MTPDGIVTAANLALQSSMHRFLSDLLIREDMAQKASERTKKKKGCDCHPHSLGSMEAPRIKEVRPFVRTRRNKGTFVHQLPVTFIGALSKSRLLSVYEIFEIPSAALFIEVTLEELDSQLEEHCCTLFVDSQDGEMISSTMASPWSLRQSAVEIFLSGIRRAADIVRLTLASGITDAPPEQSPWLLLSERNFHLGNGRWRSAPVYEANSAGLDKVRDRNLGS